MVRDEQGNPIRIKDSLVTLETASGAKVSDYVVTGLGTGMNYRLEVPMDAGITSDLYQPSALRPTVPFTIRVKIGNITYLPIEMVGNLAVMGQAGKFTRLDLTLGEDSDGDGLPDAWERSLLKNGQTLADIKPGDDTDGDGISNLAEYVAGTYAFDKTDGFALKIKRFTNGVPVLEFLAIVGRTYTVLGSQNLNRWDPVPVQLVGDESGAFQSYLADDVVKVEVEAVPDAGKAPPKFFKLTVQ